MAAPPPTPKLRHATHRPTLQAHGWPTRPDAWPANAPTHRRPQRATARRRHRARAGPADLRDEAAAWLLPTMGADHFHAARRADLGQDPVGLVQWLILRCRVIG